MKNTEVVFYLRAICGDLSRRYGTSFELEYRFHPVRRWRFDAAFPGRKIAIEVDGGVWTGGRHTRGTGFIRDQEKTNEAALLGWRVFRFVPSQLTSGEVMQVMERALEVAA